MTRAQLLAERPQKRHWLTLNESAEHLGVTERSVRRWIAAGELPAYKLGKKMLRIDAADVDAMLRPVPTAGGGRVG